MNFNPVMWALCKDGGNSGGGSGGGGSSAPADWNAKEGEPGYVKNRTHWEEEGIVTLIDNKTYEFNTESLEQGNPAGVGLFGSNSIPLKLGLFYDVVFDGVEYKNLPCVDSGGWVRIGAEYDSLMDGTAEIPFNIEHGADVEETYFATMSAEPTHTISIIEHGTVIHHLDPKYIKDMYYEEEEGKPVTLVDNQTYEFDTSQTENGGSAFADVQIAAEQVLESGKMYDVIWDGVLYADVYGSRQPFGSSYVTQLGAMDEAWMDGTSEYPFVIVSGFAEGEPIMSMMVRTAEPTHTVTIIGYEAAVHKIDRKYINGSTMFYCNNVSDTIYIDPDLTIPAMTADIDEAMSIGAIYIQNDISRKIHAVGCFQMGLKGYVVYAVDSEYNAQFTKRTGDFEGFPE